MYVASIRHTCKSIQPVSDPQHLVSGQQYSCKERSLTAVLPDGRQLGYLRFGAPQGRPFLYFHGLPGSRCEALLLEKQASTLDISLIALDRPGYGLSDHNPRQTLLQWSDDVAAFADILQLGQFGIIGVSGGGPYALACAYAMPQRLTRIAVICGLGPIHDRSLLDQMSFISRRTFTLAHDHPELFRLCYALPLMSLARSKPKLAMRMLAHHCGGVDQQVLAQEDVLPTLADSLSQGFVQGIDAVVQDMAIYQQPWGFELAKISTEVQLWHGDDDDVVPVLHSEYLAQQLPNASLTLVPGEGHFSLPVMDAEAILGALVD